MNGGPFANGFFGLLVGRMANGGKDVKIKQIP